MAPTSMIAGSQDEVGAHSEGPVAKAIEEQTAKLPSDTFFVAGDGLHGGIRLHFTRAVSGTPACSWGSGRRRSLLFGMYNKLVKQLGSDGAAMAG